MIGILKPRNKIIGQVFAGEIEQIGKNIKNFKSGDKVYGLTGFSLGAYADYKTMNEINSKQGCISLMPENLSFEEATSAAYGGLLALQFLEKKIIKPSSKVLIYGASSTSGIIALQYIKHLGAEVTCVCRENKFEFVKSLGANKVLDYTKNESIRQLENYDLIFDCVGKAKKSNLREACKNHVSTQKDFISIDDEPLLLSSNRLMKIKELVENNIIKPVNDRVFLFDQIVEAHKYVELGHKKGNVAVTVNSTT
jgi:NADPH:quinone reductase-like Zn-dependent oxidoreductase